MAVRRSFMRRRKVRTTSGAIFSQALTEARPISYLRVPERDEQRDTVLRAHSSRDVPFASHVFREKDVSRSQRNLLPAHELDLSAAAQRNHILTLRSRMPVDEVIRRRAPKLQPRDLEHL